MTINTIQACLRWAYQQLQAHSDSAELDAQVLLAHVLQQPRSHLFAAGEQPLAEQAQQLLRALVQQRQQGIPIAYLTGYKEFWSLPLQVNQHTLIPRPETEQLVELALSLLDQIAPLTIADLGTGSGAIALALASERPHWHLAASDCHAATLAVAQSNAKRLGLTHIDFYLGNWCQALPNTQRYAAIISNPPYLSENDPYLSDLSHEPRDALVAADGGLGALQTVIRQAPNYLDRSGWLMLEHGYNQAPAVKTLLSTYQYQNITQRLDLAGLPRITLAQKSNKI